MKKIIVLAVAVLMGASLTPASAAKKKQNAGQRTPAQLVTHNDSLSFAAGQTMTEGLKGYLKQQFDVDDSQLAPFIQGLEEFQLPVCFFEQFFGGETQDAAYFFFSIHFDFPFFGVFLLQN